MTVQYCDKCNSTVNVQRIRIVCGEQQLVTTDLCRSCRDKVVKKATQKVKRKSDWVDK